MLPTPPLNSDPLRSWPAPLFGFQGALSKWPLRLEQNWDLERFLSHSGQQRASQDLNVTWRRGWNKALRLRPAFGLSEGSVEGWKVRDECVAGKHCSRCPTIGWGEKRSTIKMTVLEGVAESGRSRRSTFSPRMKCVNNWWPAHSWAL